MKNLIFKSFIIVILSVAILSSCSNEEELEKTKYTIEYSITSLGDIPDYAVYNIVYISSENEYAIEKELTSDTWSTTANNVTLDNVTLVVSFTKRVPFPAVSTDTETTYDGSFSYEIICTETNSGAVVKSVNQTETATVKAESWESYINTLVADGFNIEFKW